MRKNYTRRAFLKTTGAAVLAVAVAGALSACDGSGNVPVPNPGTSTGTTRTLGNLTFEAGKVDYHSGKIGETKFCNEYLPTLTIKNDGASAVSLTDLTFTMRLKSGRTADYKGAYTDEKRMTAAASIPANSAQPVYFIFSYEAETSIMETMETAYLTIQYAGKKVTYTTKGFVFSSASDVTNV